MPSGSQMFFWTYVSYGSPVMCSMIRARIDERRVAVAEARAGTEQDLLVRQHRHELLPARRLERLPRLGAIRPGGTLEACRVRQQHPDRDVVDRAEGVVDLAQLRHPGDDLIVERQAAAVPQLHHGDRRERLGDRGPMVDRALARRLVARAGGETAVVAREHAPVA